MSSPSEQQSAPSSRWWVRLCQWLFRGLLFLWVTVVLGLALNVGATWLTTKGFDPKGTPLEWIIEQLPVALACSGAGNLTERLTVFALKDGILMRRVGIGVGHRRLAASDAASSVNIL